jgi:hypothetical protein
LVRRQACEQKANSDFATSITVGSRPIWAAGAPVGYGGLAA